LIGAASLELDMDISELMQVDLAYPPTSSGDEGVREEVSESDPIELQYKQEPESPLLSEEPDDTFDDLIPDIGSTTGPAPQPAELSPQALVPHTLIAKLRRSQRMKQPTLKAREAHAYLASTEHLPPKVHFAFTAVIETLQITTPESFMEAMKSPPAEKWLNACQTEIDSLRKNKVWKLVMQPEGSTLVKVKWVFKVKLNENGDIARYKARWVARGATQLPDIDYDETYAAMAKPVSIRTLMAVMAQYNLECKQYDIIIAFLNALIDDRMIYVEQPHGFKVDDNDDENNSNQINVCLLLRALYGLKQSPLL
jgi:hypothetical protein